MKITDVRIHLITSGVGKLRAFVTVTFDEALVVHDFRVIESSHGLFVGMPSRKTSQGDWLDIVFPIATPLADQLRDTILRAYRDEIARPGGGMGGGR